LGNNLSAVKETKMAEYTEDNKAETFWQNLESKVEIEKAKLALQETSDDGPPVDKW
jgi:hypothetical protein